MPQVPIPDQLTAREPAPKPDILPGERFSTQAPLEAFGGGQSAERVAGAFQGALGTADKFLEEQKNREDEMAVLDANYKTARLRNQLMYDPNTGAINKKGLDAAGASEEYGQQFDDATEEIAGNLTAEQRGMYEKVRQSNKLELQHDLDKHTTTERLNYYEDVKKNGVAQAQDDAVVHYTNQVMDENGNPVPLGPKNQGWNEDYIKQKIAEQKAYILTHAQANGRVSPEQVKNELAVATSQTHQKIIENMVSSGKDLMAQRYFDAHKDDITDGETLDKTQKLVRDSSILGTAQRSADAIFNKTKGDLIAADAEAQKIEDPKVREKAQSIIVRKSELVKNANEAQQTAAYKNVYQHVINGGSVNDPQIQPEVQKLTPPNSQAVRNIEEKKRDEDWRAKSAPILMDLRMKLADPINGKDFAQNLNLLTQYGDKLHPDDMKEASKLQASAIQQDRKVLDQLWTPGKAADDSLESLHITDSPSQATVRQKVLSWYKAETDRTGKQPDSVSTAAQADAIARQELRKGTIHQTFPKPPKEPKEEQYNNPVNNKTVSDEIGAVTNSDKALQKSAKAIDAAVGAAWQTQHEIGKTMSQDDLRQAVHMMSEKYTTEQRSLFGQKDGSILGTIGDLLAKDTVKRGYDIQIQDVPQKDRDGITKALNNKGAPVNDRSIVYYYIKGLAAKKAANGGK